MDMLPEPMASPAVGPKTYGGNKVRVKQAEQPPA